VVKCDPEIVCEIHLYVLTVFSFEFKFRCMSFNSGPPNTFKVAFNHLADTFIQCDLQMRRAIEAVKSTIGQ